MKEIRLSEWIGEGFYDIHRDIREGRHTHYWLKGGFAAAADAKGINWIIMVKQAPVAISKTDVTRIFDPMTNQNANAWKIDYRKYHDLWIADNSMDGVFVNVSA